MLAALGDAAQPSDRCPPGQGSSGEGEDQEGISSSLEAGLALGSEQKL